MLARLPAGPRSGGSSAGVWRSLVARFVRDEEAVGSNPATPTSPTPPPARPSRATIRPVSRGLVLTGVVALALTLVTAPAADAAPAWATLLVPRPLALADTADLWDLGATDVDRDGRPDLFTTNHNARPSLLLGDGGFGFTDVVTATGLDQDPSLPGAEVPGPPASTATAGLYLWREGNDHLAVHATVGADLPLVDVTLAVYGPFSVAADPGVDVTASAAVDPAGRPVQQVRVQAGVTGTATLDIELVGAPVHVDVVSPVATAAVSVGPGALHPATLPFDWWLQDRHGMAWSDVDGDGDLDVYVVRGGLKGFAATLPGLVSDQLFLDRDGRFVDVTASTGLAKGGCRGRRAAWVDADGDGDLDLHVTCEDGHAQLWRRTGPLRFRDVSSLLPDGTDEETFAWVDTDGDRRPELVTSRADGVAVHALNRAGRFVLRTLLASPAAPFADVALLDRDGNATPDLLFVSPRGSLLVRTRPGGPVRAEDPVALGLPATGRRVAVTDVDRDGRADVVVLPGGVFRQTARRTYAATPLLRDTVPRSARMVTTAWFDADGDGDPDAVVGWAAEGAKAWDVRLFENVAAPSDRLALDLVGPVGNREALGAVVTVVAGGVTSRHWVGEGENSRASQGVYRLDLSLGRDTTVVDRLTVTWPDGTTETLTGVGTDRTVEMTRD